MNSSIALNNLVNLLNSNEYFTKVVSQSINNKVEYSQNDRDDCPYLPEYIIEHNVTFRIHGLDLPSDLLKAILQLFPDQMIFIGVPLKFERAVFKVSWHGEYISDK